MSLSDILIVDYSSSHRDELVRMWRASFERAVGVIDPHPIEEQLKYFEEQVLPENRILVVLDKNASTIIGFMASTPEKISQLYIHINHQQRGIGSLLVNLAKQNSVGRLRLYTFDANKKAQRFYERHGFKIIGRGFEQAWQLDDLEYEWRADVEV